MTITKSNIEIISLAISIIALLLSVYSVIKSNKINRFDLLLVDIHSEPYEDLTKINFALINNSVRSLPILHITFSNSDVVYIPVTPARFINQRSINSNNLLDLLIEDNNKLYNSFKQPSETHNIIMAPNEKLYLSYYFKNPPKKLSVTIITTEYIRRFSKSKTFRIPTMEQSIQDNRIHN